MSDDPFYVSAKKSLGQHFLNSPVVPRWLCEAAHLTAGETVLEIGPGTGVLTAELLARGAVVHAVETDERSCEVLARRFTSEIAAKQLYVHHHDIRHDLPELINHLGQYKIVANIPYYLSGYILRLCLTHPKHPSSMTLLMQKEVVERITREPKTSLLQLSVNVFGATRYVRTVKPGHFNPPPRVDSAIIHIYSINHEQLPLAQHDTFFQLLHVGFAHKRKQLQSNLRRQYDSATLENAFGVCKIAPTIRAEEVSLATWLHLHHLLTTPNT